MEQTIVEEIVLETQQELPPASDTDVKPEDIPLPRSSMITVRLSDIQVHPDVDEEVEQDASPQPSIRQSSPSTRSSRSSSRTSESSISLISVDWEGLEKTEEQEKDEATDEVRSGIKMVPTSVNSSSLRLFYLPGSRKRMLRWLQTQKPELQQQSVLGRTHDHHRFNS
jgi:hypothetical protein